MPLSELLEARHTSYLEWYEPWEARGQDGNIVDAHITLRATVYDCINLARAMAYKKGQETEGNDEELLLDFMAVNWAQEFKGAGMTPQSKLLWAAWLQLHGVGQDLLDEIDRLEAENTDIKNQVKIFEYNETNFVKLLQETDPELESLRLRAVPDWGEPGVVPTENGPYLLQSKKIIVYQEIKMIKGKPNMKDEEGKWSPIVYLAPHVRFTECPIPMPREKE